MNISSIAGIKELEVHLLMPLQRRFKYYDFIHGKNLGPRVNAVCPGFIEGEWLKKGMGIEMYEAAKLRVQKHSSS